MIWYVALGSALGGAARFTVGGVVQRAFVTPFPTGTLAVNVSGALILGAVMWYAVATPDVSPELRAFLAIGICGGYTTFSTFSYETARLLEHGEWLRAGAYVGLSVFLSLGAIFVGFALARQLFAFRAH